MGARSRVGCAQDAIANCGDIHPRPVARIICRLRRPLAFKRSNGHGALVSRRIPSLVGIVPISISRVTRGEENNATALHYAAAGVLVKIVDRGDHCGVHHKWGFVPPRVLRDGCAVLGRIHNCFRKAMSLTVAVAAKACECHQRSTGSRGPAASDASDAEAVVGICGDNASDHGAMTTRAEELATRVVGEVVTETVVHVAV